LINVAALDEQQRASMLRTAQRLLRVQDARDDLITFTEVTMPHPEAIDDPLRTKYEAQYFHKALAAALQEVAAGRLKRLIITFPPRHGKTELATKRLPAWFIGRTPWKHIAVGTYNATFAEDLGRAVKEIVNSDRFQEIFPKAILKKDSQAADRQDTTLGGALYFVGRGGAITGRGADLIIIDDPIKNSEEADSAIIRQQLWDWFNNDIMSRFMTDQGAAIVIQTRWHEDDLVGRLTDPTNPCYVAEEAAQWKIINIPALAGEDDVLGRAPGAPLWPDRFGVEYLMAFKRRNPRGFNALYQQRPTPDDGDFFKADHIVEYLPDDRPPLEKLRVYMASDHAVATKQENDRTCIVVVGVDANDNIWVLDCFWKRAKSDEVVEKLIDLHVRWKPLRWWAEDDHITKSIGPFLKKRMTERKVWFGHSKVNAYADKQKKAQALQGRMSQQMVLFPKKATWWQDARDELLKFPRARHDDFVDAMSTIGRGLGVMVRAAADKPVAAGPRPGSWAWVKQSSKQAEREKRRRINFASM
jgi:predicted phage terminase large subunit-like protein